MHGNNGLHMKYNINVKFMRRDIIIWWDALGEYYSYKAIKMLLNLFYTFYAVSICELKLSGSGHDFHTFYIAEIIFNTKKCSMLLNSQQ